MNDIDSQAAETVFKTMEKVSPVSFLDAKIPECFCPMCKSAKIEIAETFEDNFGTTFFSLKCADCSTRFVLLEDLINSIRRKIENAKITQTHYSEELEKFLEID